MPKITPKPTELLQAQAATFATEQISNYRDHSYILNHLGELAAGDLRDVTRVTQSSENHQNKAGQMVHIPENTEKKVATATEYTDFLRSVGGSRYDAITHRADMLTRYNQAFKPIVTNLREQLQDPATRKEHPSFMGNGSNSAVFRITHENKEYAVRIPSGVDADPIAIDGHLAGAVLGKGVPHLEQIVAASYEDGVTVAEIMPGKEMGKNMTIEDVQAITNEHLAGLVDTLVAANNRGIEIDPKPTNIFYDREAGFGIVDYQSSKVAARNAISQDLGTIVGWMATPIMNAGIYGNRSQKITVEDYAQDAHKMAANLKVLREFRDVVKSKLADESLDTALQHIDSKIASYEETIDDQLNPQYVAERIASDARFAELRAQNKPGIDGWMTVDEI